MMSPTESIVLGGGCFWCVEAVYEGLDGVLDVTSGYAGGATKAPDYDSVCSGRTGHAEVVKITFDPAKITLDQILEWFWKAHDPTTPNRQGADVGTQYRSIILVRSDEQLAAVEKSKSQAQKEFTAPIITEVGELAEFHPAEPYHQDYYRNNPGAGYCSWVIRPKLAKLGVG